MNTVRIVNLSIVEARHACMLRIKGYAMNPRVQGRNKKRQIASHRVKMALMKA